MKFDPDNRNGRKEIMRFAQTIIQMRQPESSIFVVILKGANFSLNILVPPKSDGWPLAFYMYVNLCREGGS